MSKPNRESDSAVVEDAFPPPYKLRVFRALRRIVRAVDLHSNRLLLRHGISGPQLVCLLAIQENPDVTPSMVARAVHLSPSTVVGILDRLEVKDLIARRRSASDRRLVRLSLTAAGVELAARAPSPLQDSLAASLEQLPETELVTLAGALDRIVEFMEVAALDAAPSVAPDPSPFSLPKGDEDATPNDRQET